MRTDVDPDVEARAEDLLTIYRGHAIEVARGLALLEVDGELRTFWSAVLARLESEAPDPSPG